MNNTPNRFSSYESSMIKDLRLELQDLQDSLKDLKVELNDLKYQQATEEDEQIAHDLLIDIDYLNAHISITKMQILAYKTNIDKLCAKYSF